MGSGWSSIQQNYASEKRHVCSRWVWWGQYQTQGGRLVIWTDCVIWLRHRVLLGRERGSIWAEFWGSWPTLIWWARKDGPPGDTQAKPGIVTHIVLPTACYWNSPCCFGCNRASFPVSSTSPWPSFYFSISSLCTSSKWWLIHLNKYLLQRTRWAKRPQGCNMSRKSWTSLLSFVEIMLGIDLRRNTGHASYPHAKKEKEKAYP